MRRRLPSSRSSTVPDALVARGTARSASLACALFALFVGTAPAHAQFFNAVYSRDAIDVIAVADSGALYRSVNGGVAWTRTLLGDKPLRAVVAVGWTIVVVGDSGKVWRSADLGGSWALAVMAGTPSLRRIESLGGDELIAVGSGGTVLRSADGGVTWSPQTSGTTEQINSVRFADSWNGWIAGSNGFLARTGNGGASWDPVALGTANNLDCVDAKGGAVWVVGDDATAFRSADGGDSWSQLNLHADAQPDVKAVWVESADTVYIAGGGGFIRRSVDGGSTWSFQQHTLQGQISDLYFVGPNGWAASSRVRTVLRTNDGGATWSMPAGATTTRTWASKLAVPAAVRGGTIATNPVYKSTLYVALGNVIYRSRDDGETWASAATIPNGGASPKTNSFVVSAKDSNYWVAAFGVPDRVTWTDDGGATWHDGLFHDFFEYARPLEVDPDRPDTMFFGGETTNPSLIRSPLFRSIDRGKSWAPFSDSLFSTANDIVVVPQSDSAVILVSDATVTTGVGKYWRSTGGSAAFTQRTVAASKIPSLACSRLRNSVTFGTHWASGGVQRSIDYGLTWPNVSSVGQAYGVDIAKDDPDCVVFGTYGGTSGYVSLTGGGANTFTAIPGLPGSNYSIYVRDRGTILAQQQSSGNGAIYKLNITQTLPLTAQSVVVTSPNGGEAWQPGSVHDVTWGAVNLALARIEYQRSPSQTWQFVAEVEGYRGRYAWTVPDDATSSARIKVSDAWDKAPADSSDLGFTIPNVAVETEAPRAFALWQNRPNPFTGRTVIRYALPVAAKVRLEVYNVKGERVASLVDQEQGPGEYNVGFGPGAGHTGRALPSGIYFYRFHAGGYVATHRMVMMR